MTTASLANHKQILDGDITIDEVTIAIKSLKRNKATGIDTVSNEHFIHGGPTLWSHIAALFNLFMVFEHIPSHTNKRGVIITLPKPGKTQYNKRESYRGITLLTSTYKLFETVILNRIKRGVQLYNLELYHPLQNAYRERLCSLMTSFTLQETVHHFSERNSKTYCCVLDASSAFDTVWQDDLFYKLFNIGVNGRLWRVLRAAYKNVHSCVFYEGALSPWFSVLQSVRQGGVLSAWLYILYMNELPITLKSKTLGAFIEHNFYGCPMQADDVALLALIKTDLDKMMAISFEYSCKWRYTLNPSKSVVIIFGESNNTKKKRSYSRKWWLGTDTVVEQTVHKHVGILLSSTMKKTDRMLNATQKMRSSFFAIVGSGMTPSTTSPLTLLRLFNSVCIPRSLFGCELMNDLTTTELNMLETTYRFCLKYMTNLSKRTKTNICLASLGVKSVECIIDKCKLLFLRRLCITPYTTSVKTLFLHRLIFCKETVIDKCAGFIPDIIRILNKYELSAFIENYIKDSYFPPKCIWNHIVKNSINRYCASAWTQSVTNDPAYNRFAAIHRDITQPLLLLKTASRYPHRLKEISFFVRLLTMTNVKTVCELCKCTCADFVVHYFCDCGELYARREKFWDLISNNYKIELELELHNQPDEYFVNSLLGGDIQYFSQSPNERMIFICLSSYIWYHEYEQPIFTTIY